jgi:hypothetical protein
MADRDVQGMIDHWQSLWAAIRNGELTAKEVAVLRDCELIVLTGLLRVDRAYWER